MMVAEHSDDLKAAESVDTGHVGRPGEGGPGTGETTPNTFVVGKNFEDFAGKMGV